MRRRGQHSPQPDQDKPPLAAVLDHYGFEYRDVYGWQTIKCMFHSDSTDSLRINLDQGGFICKTYACGKSGGDAFEWIKLYEECDYPAAVEIAEGITGDSYKTVSSGSGASSRSRRVTRGQGYKPVFAGGVQARGRRKPA